MSSHVHLLSSERTQMEIAKSGGRDLTQFRECLFSSITMMSRVGLKYERSLCISGALVFLIDDKEVFVIDVKEEILNPDAAKAPAANDVAIDVDKQSPSETEKSSDEVLITGDTPAGRKSSTDRSSAPASSKKQEEVSSTSSTPKTSEKVPEKKSVGRPRKRRQVFKDTIVIDVEENPSNSSKGDVKDKKNLTLLPDVSDGVANQSEIPVPNLFSQINKDESTLADGSRKKRAAFRKCATALSQQTAEDISDEPDTEVEDAQYEEEQAQFDKDYSPERERSSSDETYDPSKPKRKTRSIPKRRSSSFTCQFCEKGYSTQGGLKKHLDQFHATIYEDVAGFITQPAGYHGHSSGWPL